MRKLFVSDLDGTLLDSDKTISEKSRGIINALIASGYDFTIATARTQASAFKILEGVKLKVPIILMNGVMVYDPVINKYIKCEYICRQRVSEIIELLYQYGIDCFLYRLEKSSFSVFYEKLGNANMEEFYNERRKKYYKSFTKTDSLMECADGFTAYMTILDSKDKILPVCGQLDKMKDIRYEFYKDIYSENTWYLEIFSCAASKLNALIYLRERNKYDYITAFGDNLNDLPLFEGADYKIAVSNANEELKNAADEIIGCNNDNAVADWLYEKYLK